MMSVGRQQARAAKKPPALADRVCRAVEAPLVFAIDIAEKGAGLREPGQAGEFIDRGDDEGWQAAIDRLIDGQNWQRPRRR